MPPTTMPHSIPQDDSTTPLADATEESISQGDTTMDPDMTMADVGAVDDEIPDAKEEIKSEVKLEDLFADIESDEEFPSSNSKSQDVKVSSSPEAPSSPV
jgi:DNA primase small subunit